MNGGPSARQRGGSTANSLWVSLGVSGVLVGLGGSYSVANTWSRMALCEVGTTEPCGTLNTSRGLTGMARTPW